MGSGDWGNAEGGEDDVDVLGGEIVDDFATGELLLAPIGFGIPGIVGVGIIIPVGSLAESRIDEGQITGVKGPGFEVARLGIGTRPVDDVEGIR